MSVNFHEQVLPYMIELDLIQQHPQNPNNGDVDAIVESILANGFYSPMVVQASTGNILAGNHRYAALLALGETRGPVIQVEVTDTEAMKILVADNRTSELAVRDAHTLQDLLLHILEEENSLVGTAYAEEDLSELTRLNRITDHAPIDPTYGEGSTPLPRGVADVRVVITAIVDEGRRRPITKDAAEELIAELGEMGYEARGEFLA